jgi:hypothetical protein
LYGKDGKEQATLAREKNDSTINPTNATKRNNAGSPGLRGNSTNVFLRLAQLPLLSSSSKRRDNTHGIQYGEFRRITQKTFRLRHGIPMPANGEQPSKRKRPQIALMPVDVPAPFAPGNTAVSSGTTSMRAISA